MAVPVSASLLWTTTARADGGAGGAGLSGSDAGAAGGAGFNGAAGGDAGSAGAQGGAGGGGAGGGQGGAGTNPGGAGGTAGVPNGGDGISAAVGSGGGGGFHGNGFTGTLPGGNLVGGDGGRGGDSSRDGFGAAGGGAGGYGALLSTSGSFNNSSSVTGGSGGSGGTYTGAFGQASDGNGGAGGIGILLGAGSRLTNSGTITGGNGGAGGTQGVGGDGVVGDNLTIINTSTGTISAGGGSGTAYSIRVDAGDLTLTNDGALPSGVRTATGAILGSNSGSIGGPGLSAANGLTFTNTASGTISSSGAGPAVNIGDGIANLTNAGAIAGSSGGVAAGGFLTLTNSGTINGNGIGASGVAVILDANVTNQAGALISGGAYGLTLFATSLVSNEGLITGGTAAIVGNGDLTVINAASGVIAGSSYGIQSCSCTLLTVTNAGSITGTSIAAISASTVNITNTGTISSDSGAGIETVNGGTITNASGATISGFTYGINASNAGVTVLNSGVITADRSSFGSRAITAAQAIILTNDATGYISGNEGVRSETSVNVTNSGTIDAQGYAIRAQLGGSSVFNVGTITGGGDGGTTAILFSGGNNTLTLAPGSSITGLVLANNFNDTFQLGGSAGSATFNVAQVGPGQQYQGFNNFIKTDNSTWTLAGTPGQATSWTINGGTLSVSANSNLGNANEAVTLNGGVLQVTGTAFTATPRTLNWGVNGGGFDIADANNSFTIAQAIGPGGPLRKLGAGTLLLTGANTYTGGTTVSAGTLQLGDGVTNGSIVGNVTNNGTLAFFTTLNTTRTFGGTISGTGQVSIVDDFNGSGTTVLTANNTYSGGTVIGPGTLSVATNANLGAASGGVLLANGRLSLGNGFSSARTISLQNGGGGGVQVDSGTATLTGGITTTGPAGFGSVSKFGNGTLVLAGTMSGNIGVSLIGGTIRAGSSTAITSSVNLSGAGTVLDLAGFSLSIGALLGQPGTLITNSSATAAILNTNNNQPFGFIYDGDIRDGAGKIGLTTDGRSLTLGGTNTYSGASVFNSQVTAGSSTAFSANSAYTVNGALNINGNAVTIGSLAGNGGVGNLSNTSGRLTTGSDNTSTTFVGSLDNGGAAWELVKVGTGTFTIAGTDNQFTGTTTVAGGNLRVNGALLGDVTVQSGGTLSGIGSIGGAVVVQSGGTLSAGQSPGTITLGALNLTAGSISQFELGVPGVVGGAGNDLVNVTGNLTLGGTLNVNAPSAGYYRLFNYGTLTPGSSFAAITGSTQGTPTVLTNIPNQVNLSVLGAGQRMQFWDGADMTGNGVVNGGAGTWNATNTNWTGAPGQANVNDQWRSSVGVFAGAAAGTVTVVGQQAFDTLQFSTTGYVLNPGAGGQLQLAAAGGAAATINTDANVTATIATPIVNGGSTALAKVGGGTLILTGTNTYTGGTTISGGTLQIGNGGTTGSITGDVVNNATLAFNRSDSVTFGGVISGFGAVNQSGAGTTILTGNNTYSNSTTIAAGTLQLGNGGTTGALGTGAVVDNATLAFNRSDTLTLTGMISGTGAVNQIGTGTTILTGSNTYTGGTTISAGTLQIGNGTTSGSIVGNVLNNSVLAFNKFGVAKFAATTYDGVISGSGALRQIGAGTTILTGANIYTGGTTISAGTLQLGNGGTTGSIVGNVVNNATLAFNRSNAVTFGGVISGSGGVQQLGAGATTLTAANTYTGDTIINAGTLAIAAGGSITSNVVNNATFTNSGTVTGTLVSTATAVNNAVITGAVTNSGSFANTAGATLGGGLTNNAGTASNAGTLNGGLTNGGMFTQSAGATTGGLTNTGTVNANGGAINGAIANNAGTFNVGGTVTSNGTFGNANGATLAVAGTYTVSGLLTNAGTLTVASGGMLDATAGGLTNTATGTITNNDTLRDDLNNAGAVTNNGVYVATVATNTGSISNAATGAWTGNVTSNAAAISNAGRWTGNVVANTGTLVNSNIWTGSIATSGSFANAFGATVSGLVSNSGATSNAGALNGGLTNTAGTTTNSGAIAGLTTLSGGTLTGTGSVANLNVTGGTFAPGSGTAGSSMTVTGSLTLTSASTYLVQINPTTSSFANVAGSATLGGATVNAVYANGSYVSQRYTILSAAGGVSGAFNTLVNTNLPSNFNASLSTDATHAYLNLALNFTPPVTPPTPTAPVYKPLNINQTNVATTLVSFFNTSGGIPLAFGALTPAGLTLASGELGVGTQQATFDAMNLFLGLLTDPFVAGRGEIVPAEGGLAAFADDALAYAANGKRPATASEREAYAAIYRKAPPFAAPSFAQRWSVWSAGYGGSQTTDGNAVLGSNTATSRVAAGVVGLDYRLSPNTLIGIALAGGGTGFSLANGLGAGRSDLFQAGAYLRHTIGASYLTAALAYGWQDVTTERVVGADRLNARFTTDTFSGRIEGGHRFATSWFGGMGITPYAAGQFTTIGLPAYTESPGVATTFGLNYAAKDVTASRSELGLRSDKSFVVQDGILTLRGRAAWAHNFNPDRSISATFRSLPGASFVVNGAAQARDAALVTASAEMRWRTNWSVAATFEGEFSNVTSSYAGKGVVRYAW